MKIFHTIKPVTRAFTVMDTAKLATFSQGPQLGSTTCTVNCCVVTTAVGDLTQKMEISVEGEMSTLKGTLNSMVDQLSAFPFEVTGVALGVGMQERQQNGFEFELVRSISEVTKAVALGDLGKLDVQGDMLDFKTAVNSMTAQLITLANKVTRVNLEPGTDGNVEADESLQVLTDNVNRMAMNLTNQVRSIAEVTKAVTGGDFAEEDGS
ncbi:hypothetical protein BYT27DRAFT_7253613 [Phlegmacium glaucopus]|nr:hypothetical protein BYT27DRAFT_7253613 [Phlegmacium glaucopus]